MENEIIKVKPEPEERLSTAGEVLSMRGEIDPVQLAKIAEERVEFFRKVSLLSLRRTSVHDWTDQGGKPYLQATGAEKLMGLWGIYTKDVKVLVEMNLETGYPCYEVTGRVGSRTLGTEMDVIGGRNANDKFFQQQIAAGMKLDLLDVRKAAYSNWIVNAVTRLIGMRGLTWEEIETETNGKITRAKATGKVEYKTSKAEAVSAPPVTSSSTTQPSGPPPTRGEAFITEPQQKRLFAVAMNAGWQKPELADYLKAAGFEHTRDIPKTRYDELMKGIEAGTSHE